MSIEEVLRIIDMHRVYHLEKIAEAFPKSERTEYHYHSGAFDALKELRYAIERKAARNEI
jgi:hypothetical protein